MLRLLATIGFACFLALAIQGDRLVDQWCEQSCPDDDADGQCAPDCVDCTCCSHLPNPVSFQEASRPVWEGLKQATVEWSDRVLPMVEPQEILHVPIAVLA